jgi:hypothetical protein
MVIDMTDKAAVFLAVFNTGGKTLVHHRVHGLTPKFERYCRASRTW